MKKSLVFYVVVVGVFAVLMWVILQEGSKLENPAQTTGQISQTNVPAVAAVSSFQAFKTEFISGFHHPLAVLIMQISTIILVARLFGFIANKIGQPTVVGEV